MPTVASTPQHEQQCQGTTPVNLAFSAHLLNRKCWLYVHFFAQTSPGFQLLLCKQKGSARAVCVILLILTTIMFTFGGVLNAQEYHQISVPEKTDLPLPPLPTPPHPAPRFLTSSALPAANTAGEGRPKSTRFVGAGLVLKTNL